MKNNNDDEFDIVEIGSLNTKPETTETRRENVRERLAMTLTYAVIGLGGLCIALSVIFPDRSENLTKIASSFLGPMIGVYGTVMGFYFNDKR